MAKNYNNNKYYTILFYCFTCILFCISEKTYSQTLIFLETFGNTSPGFCDKGTRANGFISSNGSWTVSNVGVNDTAANEWYISATEPGLGANSCAIPGCHANATITKRTLHVGNVSNSPNAQTGTICPTGDCGAIYDPGGFQNAVQTTKRAESPSFPMPNTGQNFLVFNYLYFADDPTAADNVQVYFYDGSTWSASNPPRTLACGSGSAQWQQLSILLPSISAPANVKIGFLWQNDNGGVGVNPSFAVDSIIVFNVNIPVATITVSDTDICSNSCLDFFADTVGVGAVYNWIFTGAATTTSSLQNPTSICYNNPGTFPVQLVVTTPSGSDTATTSIVVNPCVVPTANFSASSTTFCEHSCITFSDLSTNGATGWSWLFPGGVPSSSSLPAPPLICYDTPGVYDATLIVYNQFGSDTLVKTAYLNVDTCSFPIADYNSSTVQVCPQYCVSFTDNSSNGPITSYQWFFPGGSPANSISANPVVCYSQEGLYDVYLIVSNQFGPDTLIRLADINAQFIPAAFVSPDTEIFVGSNCQLNAGGGNTYLWSPATGLDDVNIPNPVASPTHTTTYTVSIDDGSGCISNLKVKVTVLHDNSVYVANTFSPNNDNINDYVFVHGNNFSAISMSIFDRWGEKVFETTDPLIGWDGRYKDQMLDPGVFTYVLTITYADNNITTQTGSVTLVR